MEKEKREKMSEEIWKDVVNYEGFYQISNLGNVRTVEHITTNGHLRKGKDRKPFISWKGYKIVGLCKYGKIKAFPVHRLVALAFIPNPNDYPMINHKDENPLNNNVENLEWCDAKYNNTYGNRLEKAAQKRRKPIFAVRVQDKGKELYESLSEASKTFDLHITTFTRAIKGKKILRDRYWYWANEKEEPEDEKRGSRESQG